MADVRPEPLLQLVRSLVETLTLYEEELLEAERAFPDVAPLRRAVSIAAAEACYWISDESLQTSRPGGGKGDEPSPRG